MLERAKVPAAGQPHDEKVMNRELGRLDTVGKPIVFGTTEEFLRCFGVSSIEELPDIDEVTKQGFMEEAMEEVAASLNVPV